MEDRRENGAEAICEEIPRGFSRIKERYAYVYSRSIPSPREGGHPQTHHSELTEFLGEEP